MGQFIFGAGNIYAVPLTDYTGTAIAIPTPVQVGTMQTGSVDFSFDEKQLYGQRQFPVAQGRGKGKVTGKATFAQLNGTLINSLVFGQTLTSGLTAVQNDVLGTVLSGTSVTPTIPLSGTWASDLGVTSNSVPFVQVASSPTAGQYSVTAGVYTFAAADSGKTVFINFAYTATSTSASKITIANGFMGYAPTFSLTLSVNYNGKNGTILLNQCTSSKFSMATKLDDFAIPEFDFAAMSDGNNVLGTLSFTDK